MKRRGEISMEVIIIAAIALLILVILSVLILRSGGRLGEGGSCSGVGGTCQDSCDLLDGETPSTHACSNPEDVCCIPVLKDNPLDG